MGETHTAALAAFHRAAERVPAYRTLLSEARVSPRAINTLAHFEQLPVLEKRNTFQRFPIEQLCIDGELGRLASVLTSSGHSGVFAFGLSEFGSAAAATAWIDDVLDALFEVRSRSTLLINCLPMGVKVPTEACTLAETSVRPDMAVGLVKAFGRHYEQLVLLGEAGFIKHVLELGRANGVRWSEHRAHVIVGEETLAENARKYLNLLLGSGNPTAAEGTTISSMGVAELGLHLFYEAPPAQTLVRLRQVLHEDESLRTQILGPIDWVPSLFTYDPQRIHIEFETSGRLLVTTLSPFSKIPLVRYAPGDYGGFVHLPLESRSALEAAGLDWATLQSVPIVEIRGRGQHALSGTHPVFPEAVKEGIYGDPECAELITANFRIVSGTDAALIRVQLSPGVEPSAHIDAALHKAVTQYVRAPFELRAERYETFGSGMSLDYERKFSYLGK